MNSTFPKACCILLLLLLSWGCYSRWHPETSLFGRKDFHISIIPSRLMISDTLFFESEGQTRLSKAGRKKLAKIMEDEYAKENLRSTGVSPEDYKIVVFGSSSVTEQHRSPKNIAKERAFMLADDMQMLYYHLENSHFEYVTLPVGQGDRDTAFSSDRFVYFKVVKQDPRSSVERGHGLICADSIPPQRLSLRFISMDNPFVPDQSYMEAAAKLVVDGEDGEVEIPFEKYYNYFLSPNNSQGSVKIKVKTKVFLDAFWGWNEQTIPLDINLEADYSVGKNGQVKTVVHGPMEQSFNVGDGIRIVASLEGSENSHYITLILELYKDWEVNGQVGGEIETKG